jgi:hypothetical protein
MSQWRKTVQEVLAKRRPHGLEGGKVGECTYRYRTDVKVPINTDKQEGQQYSHHLVLEGILTLLPQEEQQEEKNNSKGRGIVVFAHGSGSSGRHSSRNQYAASVLNNCRILGRQQSRRRIIHNQSARHYGTRWGN